MSRFAALTLLMLSIALPGASLALGLGDIHVESALHQPLVAQIDLEGATAEELAGLSAGIADSETFQQHGLERLPFLATTLFKVSQDKQGRPVLDLRSTDAFIDPVVTFLVDLHLPNGELIREYTLLLDPPGLELGHNRLESTSAAPTSAAAAAAPTAAPVATPEQTVTDPRDQAPGRTYTVVPGDTLERIATMGGAHSRSDRHRMMIAIFRANPSAFQTNLNILRSGATLLFPGAAQLSAISEDTADREFASQMATWRASGHRPPATVAFAAKPATAGRPDTQSHDTGDQNQADNLALTQRVKSLEKSIDELRQQLKQPVVEQATVPVPVDAAPAHPATAEKAVVPAVANSVPAATTEQASAPSVSTYTAPASTPVSALPATPERAAHTVVPDPTPAPVAAVEQATAPVVSDPEPVQAAATQEATDTVTTDSTPATDEKRPRAPPRKLPLVPIIGALGLALAAGFWLYRRRHRDDDYFEEIVVEERYPAPRNVEADRPLQIDTTSLPLKQAVPDPPIIVEELRSDDKPATPGPARGDSDWFKELGIPSTSDLSAIAAMPNLCVGASTEKLESIDFTEIMPVTSSPDGTTTVVMTHSDIRDSGDTIEQTLNMFNPAEDSNTTHVVLASGLNEPRPFVERRRNPVDVLQQAIEREPDRNDLRLKLLELYYTAAAQNRRAFLEITRQLAKNDRLTTAGEWSQIADMGRMIAPDDEMFVDSSEKKEVA